MSSNLVKFNNASSFFPSHFIAFVLNYGASYSFLGFLEIKMLSERFKIKWAGNLDPRPLAIAGRTVLSVKMASGVAKVALDEI